MPPIFFDTHAHLDYPDFAEDFAQVVVRAEAGGMSKIVSIWTDLVSSHRSARLLWRIGHTEVGGLICRQHQFRLRDLLSRLIMFHAFRDFVKNRARRL